MKSFEERLQRLEEISEGIREGEVPLEDAATLFEEGVRLAKGLDKDLQRIERKVRQLVNEPESPDEKPVLELFPELSEMADGTDEES
ncbi:MAG: exodeoxyribonuclease VII small subunit [Spirochaetota bacterium]